MNVKFFDLAKKISKLSDHTKFQLGCVIVRGSRIISVGANMLKTHPRSRHPYKSLHCETSAIISAKQDLYGCEIYVYRETKLGTLALSRPCQYCMPLIKEAGIKEIYYSTPTGFQSEKVY